MKNSLVLLILSGLWFCAYIIFEKEVYLVIMCLFQAGYHICGAIENLNTSNKE